MVISKHKLKNFLAEKMTHNIIQIKEEDLYNIIRFDGIKGFEQYSDDELFILLKDTIPEFKLTEYKKVDNNKYHLAIKKEHKKNADDIKVDITRIIQMKMLA